MIEKLLFKKISSVSNKKNIKKADCFLKLFLLMNKNNTNYLNNKNNTL